MKSVSLIALFALVHAAPALAQDRIELWADRNMSTCSISEPVSPPIVQIHVFVTGSMSVTGVRFTAPKPACWVGATWLGDAVQQGLAAGQSQGDWSVAFGACVPTPFYIGAISYLISGQAQPCCLVDALPSVEFVFTGCDFGEHALGESKSVMVNPNETCGCQVATTTAVEATSWGRVKALYR
jgi:hypothetical protein